MSNVKKLFLVNRGGAGRDEYRSFVVVAPDEDYARNTHPSDGTIRFGPAGWVYGDGHPADNYTWCQPDEVSVTYIGKADKSLSMGEVIIADFNAG